MGKVLVLYDSLSGNTAKMGELVAEGARRISGIEVRCMSINEAKRADVEWCDGIACGSPTNMGLMSWKMKRFWDEEIGPSWFSVDGKLGCAFSASGGWSGGNEIACQGILTILMNFGFLVFGVTDYVSETMTLHYGAISAREPKTEDVQEACRKLGERLAEWVAVYFDRRLEEHPLRKQRRKPS
jgi:NAD(P)H dehydrogenase (quinone)